MSRITENLIRKRIEDSGQPSSLQQLCLDNIAIHQLTPTIKKLIEACKNLQYLTMNDCCLQSLQNFPALRNLIVLELSDNEITGEDLQHLRRSPNINFLTIDSNQISRISNLRSLIGLQSLEILQVHDNPLTNNYNYRSEIFSILPTIKSIDCQDRQGNRVKQQDPSQYFSYRDPKSNIDLTGLIDDDEPTENNNNTPANGQSHSFTHISKTAPDYLEQGTTSRQSSGSKRSSLFNRNNTIRGFGPGLLNVRNYLDDSDSEEGNKLILDFCKKIQKKQ